MDEDKENNFQNAVADIKNGRLSYRKANKKYGIPIATLCDRVKGKTTFQSRKGKTTKLSKTDENEIVKYAAKRSSVGLGLSKKNFMTYVGSLATIRGAPFKNGKPTEKWWTLFRKRHPNMSLRKPEATTAVRHISMTKDRVRKYFDALQKVLTTNQLNASDIWNMDECGLQLAHRPNKVLSEKKNKSLHFKVSSSKETITLIACGNAEGRYLPQHVIVPGKTFNATKIYDTENAPEGTMISTSESGWTKQGIAAKWFSSNFLSSIGEKRPQLLILDGHDSHSHLELLELARENNIVLLELPAHTSNWTQPFDRSVFKSLKSKWFEYCDRFITLTGLEPKKQQFFRILRQAWTDALTPEILRSGFKACGIVPFDRNAIPEEAYAPSFVYNDPHKQVVAEVAELHVNVSGDIEVEGAAAEVDVPGEVEVEDVVAEEHVPGEIEVEIEVHSTADRNVQENQDVAMDLNFPNYDIAREQTTDEFSIYETVIDTTTAQTLDGSFTGLELSVASEEELMNISGLSSILNIQAEDTPTLEAGSETTEEMALRAIESALSPEQHAKFLAAEISGKVINDPLFHTWKKYRTKTTPVSSLFPIPNVSSAQRKRKPKPGSGYFILTCDEAYQEKKKAQQEKLRRETEKKDRLEKKIAKQLIKKY